MNSADHNHNDDLDCLQRAASLFQEGRLQEARILAGSIANTSRYYADALHLQGTIYFRLGQYEESLKLLIKARSLNANNLQLLNTLASCHRAIGDTEKAITLYEFILQQTPQYNDARRNLAIAQHDSGLVDSALKNLHTVRESTPKQGILERMYARWLVEQGKSAEAVIVLSDACQRFSHDPENFNQLGALFSQLHRYSEAIDTLEQALTLDPRHTSSLLNLAFTLQQLGEFSKAQLNYEHALQLLGSETQADVKISDIKNSKNQNTDLIAKTHYNLAIVNLTLGNYAKGWRSYRARPSLLLSQDDLYQDILPADLSGKHILVLRDQGIGDELFFLRYISLIESRGGKYEYAPHDKLQPLLDQCSNIKLVSEDQTKHKIFDYIISVADLPYALNIPAPLFEPLKLMPSASSTQKILNELQTAGPPPYVGISWRGGLESADNEIATTWRKQIELSALRKSLPEFKGTLCILQRNPLTKEIDWLRKNMTCPLIDFSAFNDDLVDMLSLLAVLDRYICVSNTNLHLRGSLQMNADVLIPFPPEWRWKDAGATSQWYSEFSLHRQDKHGAWWSIPR